MSNAQKEQLLELSSELHEYDRRPLVFEPRPYRGIRGRFGRSKRGPPSVDYMKRSLTHEHTYVQYTDCTYYVHVYIHIHCKHMYMHVLWYMYMHVLWYMYVFNV